MTRFTRLFVQFTISPAGKTNITENVNKSHKTPAAQADAKEARNHRLEPVSTPAAQDDARAEKSLAGMN